MHADLTGTRRRCAKEQGHRKAGVEGKPGKRDAESGNHIGSVVDTQVDAAYAHQHDDDAERYRAADARGAIGAVVPHHPNQQAEKRHRHHGMARGKAETLLDGKLETVGARPLDDEFERLD